MRTAALWLFPSGGEKRVSSSFPLLFFVFGISLFSFLSLCFLFSFLLFSVYSFLFSLSLARSLSLFGLLSFEGPPFFFLFFFSLVSSVFIGEEKVLGPLLVRLGAGFTGGWSVGARRERREVFFKKQSFSFCCRFGGRRRRKGNNAVQNDTVRSFLFFFYV